MSFQKRNPISKELCPFHFLVLLHLVMFTEQKSCDFTPVFICYPFEVILQYNTFCKLSAEHQCSSRIRILKLFVTIGYNRLRQVTIELKQDFSQKKKRRKKSFSELYHRFSNQVQSKEKFFFGERLARNQSTPQKFLVHILFTKFVTQSYFYNHCNSTIGTLFYDSLRGNKNGTLRTKIDKKFNYGL